MPEAEQSYSSENPTAMSRRSLLAALLAVILPKPIAAIIPNPSIGPPMPITCIGMSPYVSDLADISTAAKNSDR